MFIFIIPRHSSLEIISIDFSLSIYFFPYFVNLSHNNSCISLPIFFLCVSHSHVINLTISKRRTMGVAFLFLTMYIQYMMLIYIMFPMVEMPRYVQMLIDVMQISKVALIYLRFYQKSESTVT